MPAFRIDSAQYFLTYPQSSLVLANAFERLKEWSIQDTKPTIVVIAEERHQDGNIHHHAYLKYPKKLCVRAADIFDMDGNHPNVQSARSAKHVIKYCTKDGNYLASGIEIKLTREAGLKRLLAEINEPEEFIAKVLIMDPDWAISRFSNIRAFVEWRFRDGKQVYEPVREWDSFHSIPEAVARFRDALQTHVVGERDMRSLWLSGPSRCGKTQLARSIGTHSYMQGIWNMACLDDKAKYAVFDDIEWGSIKYMYKQLIGLQKDVNFTGKYRRPTKFVWGMPVVIITNELPVFDFCEQQWLDLNVDFCYIPLPVFEI